MTELKSYICLRIVEYIATLVFDSLIMQNWPTEYCAALWLGQDFCSHSQEYTGLVQATSMVGLAVIIGVAAILIFRMTVLRNKAKT